MSAPTHEELVLGLLSDGLPHTHHELYALGVMGHSRCSSLRRKGHRIECERQGDLYVYRLLSEARSGDVGASPSRASLSGRTEPSAQGAPPPSCAGRAAAPAAQLSMFEALA